MTNVVTLSSPPPATAFIGLYLTKIWRWDLWWPVPPSTEMGLDQVELILRVEEVFGISISDEEAGDVRTAGDLHEIVCRKLDVDSAPTVQCVNLLAFHRLRSALTGELSLPRRAVRREALVEELVPKRGRRRCWQELQAHMRLLLPSLERPNWLLGLSIAVAVIAGLGAVWIHGAIAALGSSLVVALALYYATRPLAVEIPAECTSVAMLTRTLAGLNYGLLRAQAGSAMRSEVWDSLVVVIHDQLSVAPSEIRPQASFRDDLKVE